VVKQWIHYPIAVEKNCPTHSHVGRLNSESKG
jgi:hypothetical protein